MADRYNSRIARLVGKLNGNTRWAVTISKNTTLYSVPLEEVTLEWRRHENAHKRQIIEEGSRLKFMVKYFFFNLTRSYANNPYEIEARLAAQNK